MTWLMRLRIAAVSAVGILVIGILLWPVATTSEPVEIVSFWHLGVVGAIALLAAAFGAGFVGYFLSWPYGRWIGVIAVPMGLGVWGVRSGSMASFFQMRPDIGQRVEILSSLKWEGFLWLAVAGVGVLGVLAVRKMLAAKSEKPVETGVAEVNSAVNLALGVVAATVIGWVGVGLLAQDIRGIDSELGQVAAQPSIGQIVFAVFISFAVAGFVIKEFLKCNYLCVWAATSIVSFLGLVRYGKASLLGPLGQRWPAVFFPNVLVSIIPVQMVSYGCLGAVLGYWLAVQYDYWRKHG